MDTDIARTFLAVVATGTFVGAAEYLHVSQSTVSARIQALEALLKCTLFIRNKNGAVLTSPGRQLQRHASTFVRTFEQARQDVGVPEGFDSTLVVSGRIGLWDDFLLNWLPLAQQRLPSASIRAESGMEPEIMQGLIEGRVDIGVMYTPQSRPGFRVEELFSDLLVMVSTDARADPTPDSAYVYVDWGPEFFSRHNVGFPNSRGYGLIFNIGWLGLQYILKNGGFGYFPLRIVLSHLECGALIRLAGAPEFVMPAYAVYPTEADKDINGVAIEVMRTLAKAAKD